MIKNLTIIFIFSLSCLFSTKTLALDPKVKAVMIMAGYGTVGGALLGTASLAFGTTGRSVAKGASIGLYAGLLFGSYILISYKMKRDQQLNPEAKPNYYPDTTGSPYESESSQNGEEPPAQRSVNLNEINSFEKYENPNNKVLLYIPVFRLNF